MRAIIVNADGFGFTFGNNRAILEVLAKGFVRSVSANVTWPAVREVQALSRDFPHVSIGIHFNLSVGPPVLPPHEIPSLVSEAGEFLGERFAKRALRRGLDPEEMRRELRAQVEVLGSLGAQVTHWDSHQGRHNYPGFFEAALDVAKEHGIAGARSHSYHAVTRARSRLVGWGSYYGRRPLRIPTHLFKRWQTARVRRAGFVLPDHRIALHGLGPRASADPDIWRLTLRTLPEGTSLMDCHPGYPDETLARYSSLVESRSRELDMLLREPWTEIADSLGVEPCSYFDLLRHRQLPDFASARGS